MSKKYNEPKATPVQAALIREFARDIKEAGELTLAGVADRKLAAELKTGHARAGKLSPQWCESREMHGKAFLAIATDGSGVGTSFVLLADGRRLCI